MTTTSEDPTRKGFLTNYPPFRYWRPEAVEGFASAKPLNVYVHVPYCVQRCEYCFYKVTTLGDNRKAEIDRYVAALCTEIERVSRRFHLDERPVETIYFGGGTPTILSRENLSRIFAALRSNLQIQADAEITVEAEPVTLIESKARHLESLGVNRISMGIQSFHDEVVARTGRADREEHAHRAIALAKATGAAVNIDLMSGLAGESDETWAYSVERAIETEVHSLTVYKTQIYPNSTYFGELRRKSLVLPTDSDEMRWALKAHERFEQADYLPVNFFTYTKGGRYMQRHATNSWRGGETYGFGVSAFGMLAGHTLQNAGDVEPYVAAVEAGELPLARGYRLDTPRADRPAPGRHNRTDRPGRVDARHLPRALARAARRGHPQDRPRARGQRRGVHRGRGIHLRHDLRRRQAGLRERRAVPAQAARGPLRRVDQPGDHHGPGSAAGEDPKGHRARSPGVEGARHGRRLHAHGVVPYAQGRGRIRRDRLPPRRRAAGRSDELYRRRGSLPRVGPRGLLEVVRGVDGAQV
ncbi:MAG: coproporphyrinogen III oxidase family protein [Deltaproteobacteria bacterium]|nr:coproporphyrinogen III oxidase family protein [Deltaproteobacteria bacterium]